jgi:hypothetical protein
MSKTQITLLAQKCPELFADFRQGIISGSCLRGQLWEAGFAPKECFDVEKHWARGMSREDVAAASRR